MIFEEQIISIWLRHSSKTGAKIRKQIKKSEKLLLNYAFSVNPFEKLLSLSTNLNRQFNWSLL